MRDLNVFGEAFLRFQHTLDQVGIGGAVEVHLTEEGYTRLLGMLRDAEARYYVSFVNDPSGGQHNVISYSGVIFRPVSRRVTETVQEH